MSDLTERLRLLIQTDASGAIKDLKAVGDGAETHIGGRATSAIKTFTGNSSFATTAISKIQGAFNGISPATALAGAGVAAAGVAIADFALKGVQQFSDLTLKVTGFQRATGASAEDSSKLVFALTEMGVPVENVQKGIFKLEQTVGNGTSKLNDFGISVAKNKDGTFNLTGTLENVGAAFQHMKDPAQKAALLFDVFGKSGQNMVPILEKSKKDLHDLFAEAGQDHQIFSQADLQAGIQYRQSMESLHAAVQGVEVELGQALIPTITHLTETATGAVHGVDSLTKSGGGASGVFHAIVDAALPAANVLDFFGGSSSSAKTKADALSKATDALSGSMDDGGTSMMDSSSAALTLDQAQTIAAQSTTNLTSQQKQEIQAAQGQLKAFQDLQNAVAATISSDLGYTQSQLGVTQAVDTLNKATLENAAAKGQDGSKALALQQATLGLTQSIQGEATAASKKAQDDMGPNATATQKAITGHQAYEAELQRLSQSAIPAVRLEATSLLQQAQQYDRTWNGNFTANTSQAQQAIDQLTGKFQGLVSAAQQLPGGAANTDAAIHFLMGGRAAGGSVTGGSAYVVGERGPELFVPDVSGQIVPNDKLQQSPMMPVGGAGGTTNYQINVNGAASNAETGRVVVEAIKQFERRSGTGWRN